MSRPTRELPPPTTMTIVAVCSLLFVAQQILPLSLNQVTLSPRLVIRSHQYYRILTSGLFHANLMHIGMNMLSTVAIGTSLERRLGTWALALMVVWSMLLTPILYIAMAWLISVITANDRLLNQQSVGFSAVLFQLLVVEVHSGTHGARNLFGMVSVPSYVYPWVLLLVLQVLLPNLSLLGHLSGILIGYAQVYGMLDYGCLPQVVTLRRMEEWPLLHCCRSWPGFVPTGDGPAPQTPRALVQAVCQMGQSARTVLGQAVEAVGVMVLGRGRANVNLGLGGRLLRPSDDEDDDDEWDGLPPAPAPQATMV